MNRAPSIFNEVIGPVMRGPSSSHTAGAHRIGSLVRQLCPAGFNKVTVEFDRKGALATTYLGQGSAMGLAGGLLGISLTDPEIVDFEQGLTASDLDIRYIINDYQTEHPSTYRISLHYPDRKDVQAEAVSTGGGMIEIIKWNGTEISMKGDCFENLILLDSFSHDLKSEIQESLKMIFPSASPGIMKTRDGKMIVHLSSIESLSGMMPDLLSGRSDVAYHAESAPVLPVLSGRMKSLPFTSLDEMLGLAERDRIPLSELAIQYECARSGLSSKEVLSRMKYLSGIIRNSIREGLDGTEYEDRLLGPQSQLILTAEKEGVITPSMNNKIIAYTSAIMEVKSSMGLIVAAPTAGSCGVIGGAFFGTRKELDADPEGIARAFMAAGIIGVFIADQYTFAAEEGGCQVECGAASAMAAAGLTEMMGGTAQQAVNAASFALQNLIGMICDPVASRVEVPCLGKNILGATNTVNAATMILSGFDHLIPLDQVIAAMKSVGDSLPSSLCCTGLGGLAQTPFARGFE